MGTSKVTLMRDARSAIKSGQLEQARTLLKQAIRLNPEDHVPWIWLAGVTTDPEASMKLIRRAESLKPDDPLVIRARKWAEARLPAVAPAPARPTVMKGPVTVKSGPNWKNAVLWAGAGLALILFAAVVVVAIARPSDRSEPVEQSLVSATEPQMTAVEAVQVNGKATTPVEEDVSPAPTATPTAPRLLAKNIAPSGEGQSAGPRPTWTMTPIPTDTPTPTPTLAPTFVSPQVGSPAVRPLGVGPHERWIDVDLSTQTLAAYEGNALAFSSLISSGTWDHPTVTGQFRVWVRYESQTMDGRRLGYDYYLENVPYVMYFYEDYALHGTFWHNNFGTPMSHGCVNMKTSDAQWIFEWSRVGTVVNVHH